MTITNEERRRVAARLRDFYNIRPMFMESAICGFLDVLNVDYLDWEGICNRLADLIEPEPERTCHLDYERHCSNCGVHVHESSVLVWVSLGESMRTVKAKPVNYCPNCGAKVV